MWTRVAWMVTVLAGMACGGSTGSRLEPGAGNDPGTQTGTIIVSGTVVATPLHANASAPSEFTSEFQVLVRRGSEWVGTGTVAVTSASGTVPLVYIDDGHFGVWKGSAPGYDEVYVLDVVSGTDRVEGVRVDGPDIHVFSQPAEGALVDLATPLILAWDRDEQANAQMRIDSIAFLNLRDNGQYSLSPEIFAVIDADATQHTVELIRELGVAIKNGGAWNANVVNTIDVMTPAPQ